MNCKKYAGQEMSAYVDGMLEGDRLRQMSMHVEQCESCRAEYESLTQVRSLLRKMTTPSVPSRGQFWDDAYRAARLAAQPATASRAGVRRGVLTRMAVGVGFAAALLVGIVMFNGPGSHTNSLSLRSPVNAAAVVDVGELVQAHANFAASQPLSDRARLTMVTSEIASQNSEGGSSSSDASDSDSTEPAVNAAIGMD